MRSMLWNYESACYCLFITTSKPAFPFFFDSMHSNDFDLLLVLLGHKENILCLLHMTLRQFKTYVFDFFNI